MAAPKHELLLVLDFGSQYSELIARRLRELNIYSELHPYHMPIEEIKKLNPKGIILSGGPDSVYEKDAPTISADVFKLGIPVLGLCYGMQLIAKLLGGEVDKSHRAEYGKTRLFVKDHNDLFQNVPETTEVWMSHGDSVSALPPKFNISASTDNTQIAAMSNRVDDIYAMQFHPEVAHSIKGMKMLKNFAHTICGMSGDWTMANYINESVEQIRAQVGDSKVLLGLSGGVDSSSLAFLLHKAIGDNLVCMFIDQGFMRYQEPENLVEIFDKQAHLKVHYIDAKDRFMSAIKGVSDPEEKRKIIGREFIRTFEEESAKLGVFKFLAQGTLYPDVVESAQSVSGKAVKIKSHHNVGGLPEDMQFGLVEPFRKLFKDEVREVGRQLKLPEEIVNRHPFPGPGLAIRILGEITEERLSILKHADKIIRDVIVKHNLHDSLWQVFAVLLPVRSVGVMGDKRTYSYPIVLRAVSSEDGMTADWAKLPYDVLEEIANRVINEVHDVNRVVYDITSKPPGTIEWE
jgi:GMP synthase (glutamine-hydrolysing)